MRHEWLIPAAGFLVIAPAEAQLRWKAGPRERILLLPGALLMTMSAQFLAPFMFVNLRFSTFL